jgi:hypothetical protein
MQTRTKRIFVNVRTEGSLLPSDLLQRIADAKDLPGLKAEDYGLTLGETLNESINRSWARLQSLWATFQKQRAALPEADAGTTLTRRWLQVVFQELAFGQSLQAAEPILIEGKPYPISHAWKHVPIHLVSFKADLDSRSAFTGAKNASPHSIVQELLNRSGDHLWAFLANGLRLRVLRDNVSLTRQAFVEFDLETIFDSEAYADFRLFWLLCHESRVETDKPEQCWLEKWTKEAQDTGRRALEQLRQGVQQAIEALGQGFIAHTANKALQDRLQAGILDNQDFYRQLLRLIYRLIFLFVAEDRGLLLDPKAAPEARERYMRYYSGQRLRRLAERHRGTRHYDIYQGLRLVFDKLGCDEGCSALALPALGSLLFSPEALPDLQRAEIGNEALLDALRRLALTRDKHGLRLVDFRNLGSEELGSVYESLLELHPEVTTDPASFKLLTASGNERKTTGSYYTPDSLIQCLLDSTLDPVLNDAAAKAEPEKAILGLKVCDPACGSGHFLIAAAHRIAKMLASIRTGDEAPTPDAQRAALRDVIGHCLFGVDLNPMAVELCKVNLWLEALELGKPLSFLDAHIQCGNSLLGTTPGLLVKGIPEEAFTALVDDDPAAVSDLKRKNKKERAISEKRGKGHEGHTGLFSTLGRSVAGTLDAIQGELLKLEAEEDSSIQAIHAKESRFRAILSSPELKNARIQANAWCASFVWEKSEALLRGEIDLHPITQAGFEQLCEDPDRVAPALLQEVQRLTDQHQWLHWHLSFPQVFRPGDGSQGWNGGFDVVLGNPPWETLEMKEEEWFATRDPRITNAANASIRKLMIADLAVTNPILYKSFTNELRLAQGERHLIRNAGNYPLCATGKINTYSIFTERMRNILSPAGYMGVVIPTAIAFADTTKFFFQDIVSQGVLKSLFSFFETRKWFPDTDSRDPFCLLTISGSGGVSRQGAELVFDAVEIEEIEDTDRRFRLDAQDIRNLNPNTGTCALFRNRQDADITKGIYRRVPVLILEATERDPEKNNWGISFSQGLFNMASDSSLFRSAESLFAEGFNPDCNRFVRGSDVYLPLYEAKMLHHFNHRWGDYAMRDPESNSNELPDVPLEKLQDPYYQVMPNNWVPEQEVMLRSADLPKAMSRAFRNGQANVVAIGLAYWAFGNWLHREGLGSTNLALSNLFETWLKFNQAFPWAQFVAPTQLGLCPDGEAYIQAVGPQFIPAVPMKELQYDRDSGPCWYEAKKVPLERLLKAAEECPLMEEEWTGLQFADDANAVAQWILERRTPKWLIGWRRSARGGDSRTMLPALLPRAGVGDSFFLFTGLRRADMAVCILANLTSFAADFVVRQKAGGPNLSFFVMSQIAVIPPETYSLPAPWSQGESIQQWLQPRILELTYTSWDLQPFAQECGFDGPPFAWDEERRFQLRCELDAAFFHLYGLNQDETAYVMDTFDKVAASDLRKFGSHRTKHAVLDILHCWHSNPIHPLSGR